ncbi:unnamed protein product [Heterosigma akashiwo]|mmetsp:Transcript_48420/g.70775  ORF Transcript_48420/g.70775 Transcript_48420/m.70775 type:complete len:144 (+) Transcript_48420:120-551(+)
MKGLLNSLPQGVAFAISGGIGNIIFFGLDQVINEWNPFEWQKIAVSFTVSYLISVWFQHLLHQVLVFGSSSNYWSSLFATYATYALSIVASPICSSFFSTYLGASQSTCWLLTVGSTGVMNYFLVSKAMDEKGPEVRNESKKN